MRRLLVGLVTASLVGVVGCGGGGDDRAAREPKSFVDHLSERLTKDGKVPFDAALELYTTAIGALPGVDVPRFPGASSAEPSLARYALTRFWDRLTEQQRRTVVEDAFGPDARHLRDAVLLDDLSAGPAGGTARSTGTDTLANAMRAIKATLEARLGPIRLPVYVTFLRGDVETRGTLADATPLARSPEFLLAPGEVFYDWYYTTAYAEPPQGCHVRITTSARTAPREAFNAVVAHEIFHCFQYGLARSGDEAMNMPLWVIEGQAAWVGEQFGHAPEQADSWWVAWVRGSRRALYERDYDAIGFYSLLEQLDLGVWGRLEAVASAGMRSSDAAYAAAVGAASDLVLTRLAPVQARAPALGPAWEIVARNVTPTASQRAARGTLEIPVEATRHYEKIIGQYASIASYLQLHGDVLEILTNGNLGAIGFAGVETRFFTLQPVTGVFCIRPGGCECPGGGTPPGVTLLQGSRNGVVAVASDGTDPVLEMEFRSHRLSDVCRRGLSTGADEISGPRGGAECLQGTWQPTKQELRGAIRGMVGDITLRGGLGGRRLILQSDGSYRATDDGSDPVTAITESELAGSVVSNVEVVADARGTWSASDEFVDFALESLTGQATVTIESSSLGEPIVSTIDLNETGFEDAYGFGGHAEHRCTQTKLTLTFSADEDADSGIRFELRRLS